MKKESIEFGHVRTLSSNICKRITGVHIQVRLAYLNTLLKTYREGPLKIRVAIRPAENEETDFREAKPVSKGHAANEEKAMLPTRQNRLKRPRCRKTGFKRPRCQ